VAEKPGGPSGVRFEACELLAFAGGSPTPRGDSREGNLTSGVERLMFTVLQRYRVRLGTVADAAARAEETLVPRLRQLTGFITYHLLHTGDSTVAALALFETRPAADAGVRLLSEWFRSDWPAFRLLAPDLSVAESLTLANGDEGVALEPVEHGGLAAPDVDAALDPRMDAELPLVRDRRRAGERRILVVATTPERRSGVDRRATVERRTGLERRGGVAPTETTVIPERRRIAPSWRRREPFHSR